MTLPFLPIWFVNLLGSILMIILSFMCLGKVVELKKSDESNVIWIYLLWICCGFIAFAMSRSIGHILKWHFLFSGSESMWNIIRPYTGAVNTLMFVFVASVTLFFERIWKIHQQVVKDKQALQSAHQELLYLSQNLENRVVERTASLAVSESKYRRIFEVSRDMILVAEKEGVIVDMNPAGYKMLGFNDADRDLKQKRFKDFFASEADWKSIISSIVKKGFVSNYEVALKRSDGSEMRSLVSGSVDNGPSEDDDTIHFLVKDIEQRRLIENQMAQTEKLASIGQLSAGIAHAINNPLGIILGYAQMLIRDEKVGTERYADLKTIEKHVKNCRSTIEDLLSVARSSPTARESVRIHEIVDEVLNFIQHHSELYHIEIEKDYDMNTPPLLLNEKKTRQVLMNLILNATHAVGKSGTIRLSTAYNRTTRDVTITVADTGYGIEKKNLSRIFDPFFTTKPTGEGTGLGLSVSYGIIKNHGGHISVDSRPGKGATFTVVLPANAGDRGDNG
ncbi:MAG: PAS domain S-box protein [Desulfobacteraceae bacterium]|nr:PAS domain S-box protein [Desulfobacteraceae bacterium]MBC2754628.1 PAS domain S-box protein [Desulfobacteraceae bacterium]